MEVNISCDIGEGWGVYRIADDAELLKIVSSANVACGFHAGDPQIMLDTVEQCKYLGVAVGGHFGKPDLQGFGRRDMSLTADEIYSGVLYQCGALEFIARAAGWPMRYVSFHGNLGSIVSRDHNLAERLLDAWLCLSPKPVIQGMPGDPLLVLAKERGLGSNPIFLPDRAYHIGGSLVARGKPGAVLTDHSAIRDRIRQFVETGCVTSIEAQLVSVNANTIVIHSDTPGSLEIARVIKEELELLGVKIKHPFGRQ